MLQFEVLGDTRSKQHDAAPEVQSLALNVGWNAHPEVVLFFLLRGHVLDVHVG